jgi:hypothetical protein
MVSVMANSRVSGKRRIAALVQMGLMLGGALAGPGSHLEAAPLPPTKRPFLPPIVIPHATRPSRDLLRKLLADSKTAAQFRLALIDAKIPTRVQRVCFVSGGYPANAKCVSVRDLEVQDWRLVASDQSFIDLAFNDLWDMLGGAPGGGDLVGCGGSQRGSLTDWLAVPTTASSSPPLSRPGSPGGKIGVGSLLERSPATTQLIGGSELAAMTSACRDRQTAGIRAGLGEITPEDPAYQRAVEGAVTAMNEAAASCHDSNNGMISNPGATSGSPGGGSGTGGASGGGDPGGTSGGNSPPGGGGSGTGGAGGGTGGAGGGGGSPGTGSGGSGGAPSTGGTSGTHEQTTAAQALTAVATVTKDLFGALDAIGKWASGCTSTAKCAANAVWSLFGLAVDSTGAVSHDKTVAAVGNAATVADGALAVASAAGSTAAPAAGFAVLTDTVLPVLAVFSAAYTIASPLGEAIADARAEAQYYEDEGLTPPWQGAASPRPAPHRSALETPAPGPSGFDQPTCAQMQSRWQAFQAYCSQPGNNWQSYDCMLAVARLNGCADPGVVLPVPGEQYTCVPRCVDQACRRQRAQQACELGARQRGLVSQPDPDAAGPGSCSYFMQGALDVEASMQSRLCEHASDPSSCGPHAQDGLQQSPGPQGLNP